METDKNDQATRTIDLGKYRSSSAIVLSGRPRAVRIRELLELDAEDRKPTRVQVVIPEDILSLNSSFFLGLFDRSIKSLGVRRFEEKYQFICTAVIREDVDKGKREAVNTSNALLPA
jgi:hypothetical protein